MAAEKEAAKARADKNWCARGKFFVCEQISPLARQCLAPDFALVWDKPRGAENCLYIFDFVHDSGMGLSAADKEKLFQKFSRASGGATNTSGLGIGLYLAAKMVQDHAGKIWAESEGPGKGSTFIIHLPVHSELAVEREELVEGKG